VRALTLAREVGVLPAIVRIVGCQVADADSYVMGLAPAVEAAIPAAVAEASALVARLHGRFDGG